MLSASIVQPGSHINAYAAAGGHSCLQDDLRSG
jgi:hypothetical protein